MRGLSDRAAVRGGWRFWVLLSTVVLLYSAIFSTGAPGGRWENRTFGSPLWSEEDPGGFYLPSAHQIFDFENRPLFPGHPGASLHLVLHGVQKLHFALASPEGLTFTEFTARFLRDAWIAAKLAMTLLHLLSFFLIYRLARRLTTERAAVIATLGYASSLTVLHFISRISVEPLMVIFFVGTLLALAASLDRLQRASAGPALAFAGLAGALAISGTATKMNFLGPLPFFGVLILLVAAGALRGGDSRWRRRAGLAATFTAGASIGGVAWLEVIHVGDLRELWTWIATAQTVSPVWDLERFLPSLDVYGIFQFCELLFIAAGVVGWVRFLRRPSSAREEAGWWTLYFVFATGLWGLRVAWLDFRVWQYFFITNIGLAIFFGFLCDEILEKLRTRTAAASGWLGALALVAIVHGAAIVAAVESRVADIGFYEGAPVYDLAESLGPGDEIQILRSSAPRWFRTEWNEGSMTLYSGLRSIDDCPPATMCIPLREQSCPVEKNLDIIVCALVQPVLFTEFQSLFRLVSEPPSNGETVVLPGLGRAFVVRAASKLSQPSASH